MYPAALMTPDTSSAVTLLAMTRTVLVPRLRAAHWSEFQLNVNTFYGTSYSRCL